ncbi:leucine-rich repeat domain-containing protein [Bifidobacterium sp. ESL0798]|uniref:leucine-rich repeat domain-containing protein n=1 Tax=Bifidobacterium sp. ESL0798 TaxID=2983235 RepID=UPI0023F8D165|nr:leucine-rich repeat domain-containing protein [Bifidobacterium sp. ESL0798]
MVSGKTATAPADPSRNGYLFQKWQTNQGGRLTDYDFGTPVTGDITLHAAWLELSGCVVDHTSIAACFPDRQLAKAVAKAQSDDTVSVSSTFTQVMVDHTTRLSSFGNSSTNETIKDLTGLDQLVNLTYLDLSDNEITDITPVGNLSKLTWLNLSHNRISDISPLAGLGDGKAAVRALAGQTTTLPRTRSLASSPSALIGTQSDEPAALHDLNLAGNSITDTSALSGLTSLTDLDISGNQIDNVAPLSDLQNLTELNIADNKVADISPLSGLKKLTSLNLDNNQVGDVKPLAGLAGLTDLSLDGNHISDTAPLTGLSGLTTFNLKDQNSSVTVRSLSPATIELPAMNRVDYAEATCAPSGCSASVIAPQSLSGYSVKVSYPEGTKEGTLNFSETGALGSASGIVSGVITLKLSAPESGSGSSSAPAQPGTAQPGQQPIQKPAQGPASTQKHIGRAPSPQAHGRTGQRIASTGAAIAAVAVLALLLIAAGLTIIIMRRLSASSQKNEADQQSNSQFS